jgi:hypothetical protein
MSNINVYVINALLVLLVIRQIREHPLDLRSLAIPVLAVGVAAFFFLHSVPLGGNDIALELACVLTGALMGAIGGFATYLRRGADGRPLGHAGPAIARFSVANHITGEAAWIAALIMMALADVLTRLVIIYLRGRRLAASAPAPVAPIAGGVGA